MRIPPSWSLLVLFVALAAPAPAADKAATLNDDIRFAQDLARFRFFDLAVDWLAEIEKKGGLNEDNRIEVSLAKAKVSELAALNALTRDARKRYYDESVEHYTAAIGSMAGGMTLRRAEATAEGLARVLIDKGTFWVDEMEILRSQDADEAARAEARAKAEEAFRDAVKTLNSAYADITEYVDDSDDLTEQEQGALGGLALFSLYRKGEAYFHWAHLYEAQDFNREDYFTKCIEALTDYLWEAGEDEIVLTCLAYFYQGMSQWELGKIDAEQASKHDVKAIAQLEPIHGQFGLDPARMSEIGEDERAYVLGVLERGVRGEAQIYRHAARRIEESTTIDDAADLSGLAFEYGLKAGKGDPKPWQIESDEPIHRTELVAGLRAAAIGLVTELERRVSSAGIKLTQEGERARLEKARAMIDAGRPSEALQIVTDVASKNENTMVGLEANSLLGSVIDETGGAAQPPSVWWLASEGHYAEERWLDAIETSHRTIGACATDDQRREFVSRAWLRIAECYQRMNRNLEAALACQAGLDAAKRNGDDDGRDELALDCYNAWNRRFTETKDSFDEKQRDRIRDEVTRLGVSADLAFIVAKEAYTNATAIEDPAAKKAAFLDAVKGFQGVPESSAYFERGMVYIGRCYADAAQVDKANVDQALVAKAIESWDALEKRAADPKKAVGIDRKKSQQRTIALAEATFYKAQLLQDNERWDDVLATLDGYESTHENQTDFFAPVNYYRLKALSGLGRLEEAEKIQGRLESEYAKSAYTMYGKNVVANGHFAVYDKLPEDQRGTDEAKAHLRSAAEYLDGYNKARGYDSFTNILLVANWYRTLGESKIAAEQFQRVLDRFGKDPRRQRAINDEVKPAYAAVLLDLREFADALPLWREVYAAKPTNRDVVVSLARCLGGWLDEETDRFGGVTYKPVLGAGKHEEAVELLVKLRQGIEAAEEKYQPVWWDVNVLTLYNVVQWSKGDPRIKVSGQKLIKNWTNLMPDLGGDPWARRLKFLEGQLN